MRWSRWSEDEDIILKKYYPNALKHEILKSLPTRTWEAIRWRANKLRLYRKKLFTSLGELEKINLKIKDEINKKRSDLAYIAGFVDGEGCYSLCKHKEKNKINSVLSISNIDRNVLEYIQTILGGEIYKARDAGPISKKLYCKRTLYSLVIARTKELLRACILLEPFLRVKRKQNNLMRELCEKIIVTNVQDRVFSDYIMKMRDLNHGVLRE